MEWGGVGIILNIGDLVALRSVYLSHPRPSTFAHQSLDGKRYVFKSLILAGSCDDIGQGHGHVGVDGGDGFDL